MRIAFYGGSFDPPHRGHLAVARAALARMALDRVLLAPVGTQPLKENSGQASFADRLAMVRLAVAGDPRLSASDLDAPQPGGRPNYTFDTLRRWRNSLPPGNALFCLIGADSLFSFKQWHRAGELILFCDFIVAGRPGFSFDEIGALLPDGIRLLECRRQPESIRVDLAGNGGTENGETGAGKPGNREKRSALYLLPGLDEDVSATEIRNALADGSQTQTVLPPAVADYIHAHALYCSPAEPSA